MFEPKIFSRVLDNDVRRELKDRVDKTFIPSSEVPLKALKIEYNEIRKSIHQFKDEKTYMKR